MRRPDSGNAHGLIKGIGVVTGVYVKPQVDEFGLLDYRIDDPEGDGKSKLDQVSEMLVHPVDQKQLPFQAVLMDTWYATKDLMLLIESLDKKYSCPLKDKRQGDDSGGQRSSQRVESLHGNADALIQGKILKIKGFPKNQRRSCFRVAVSTHRTDFVVTHERTQNSTAAVPPGCGCRWQIEQLHREGKQVTGLEACQCRKARIHRNHIGCALLVWVNLKRIAAKTGQTLYQLKHGLLDDYLCQQLKSPSLIMTLA